MDSGILLKYLLRVFECPKDMVDQKGFCFSWSIGQEYKSNYSLANIKQWLDIVT